MAKGRVLSRSEARDRSVNELEPWAIIGWHRLIAVCDDDGRHIADSDVLKPLLFPRNHEVSQNDVGAMVAAWVGQGLVVTYEDGDSTILQVLKWNRHQTIRRDRYMRSDLTPPPGYTLVNDEWEPCDNQSATTPQPCATPNENLNLNENVNLDLNEDERARETPVPVDLGKLTIVSAEYERLTASTVAPAMFAALCAVHPSERIIEAIRLGVEKGKTSLSYIGGIAKRLAAEGWKPDPVITSEPNQFYGLCGEKAQA